MTTTKKISLIINPFASSFSERKVKLIERALKTVAKVEVLRTEKRSHAIELAKNASETSEMVCVLGGDGTLNEAAQGLLGTQTILIPLPGGSTNVFARAIGYSNDVFDALSQVIDSIEAKKTKRIGVGSIDDRIFLFNAGIGLDAEVIARVEKNSKIKKVAAHPFTLSTAITTYVKDFDRKEQQMSVLLGDEAKNVRMYTSDATVFAEANLVVISNLSPWTYLGMREVVLAPTANLDDALTITAVRALNPVKLMRIALSALGKHKTVMHHKDIAHCDHVHNATIATNNYALSYQVDGDYLGTISKATIKYISDALTIQMPVD